MVLKLKISLNSLKDLDYLIPNVCEVAQQIKIYHFIKVSTISLN